MPPVAKLAEDATPLREVLKPVEATVPLFIEVATFDVTLICTFLFSFILFLSYFKLYISLKLLPILRIFI